jgi:hypothetical protein
MSKIKYIINISAFVHEDYLEQSAGNIGDKIYSSSLRVGNRHFKE